MLIEKVTITTGGRSEWPFNLPAVRCIAEEGLSFTAPITVLGGENGTGRSTLIEAIAEAYGLDVRGGQGGRKYSTTVPPGELSSAVRLHRTAQGPRFYGRRAKGFFLRAETAHGVLNFMSDYNVTGYGDDHAAVVSHGEGYKQVFTGRFSEPGLYLLDEAEGPLCFLSTLQLMHQLVALTAALAPFPRTARVLPRPLNRPPASNQPVSQPQVICEGYATRGQGPAGSRRLRNSSISAALVVRVMALSNAAAASS